MLLPFALCFGTVSPPVSPHYYSYSGVIWKGVHCFRINKGLSSHALVNILSFKYTSLSPAHSRGQVQIKHIIRPCWESSPAAVLADSLYPFLYELGFLTFVSLGTSKWSSCWRMTRVFELESWTETICSMELILAKWGKIGRKRSHTPIPRKQGGIQLPAVAFHIMLKFMMLDWKAWHNPVSFMSANRHFKKLAVFLHLES